MGMPVVWSKYQFVNFNKQESGCGLHVQISLCGPFASERSRDKRYIICSWECHCASSKTAREYWPWLLWCSLHTLQLLGVSDYFLFRSGICAFRIRLNPTLLPSSIRVVSIVSKLGFRLAWCCPKGFRQINTVFTTSFLSGRQSYLPSKFEMSLSAAHVLNCTTAPLGNDATIISSRNFGLKGAYIFLAVSQSPPDCFLLRGIRFRYPS